MSEPTRTATPHTNLARIIAEALLVTMSKGGGELVSPLTETPDNDSALFTIATPLGTFCIEVTTCE